MNQSIMGLQDFMIASFSRNQLARPHLLVLITIVQTNSYLCSLHDPFDPGNGNWPLYECVQQDFLSPYIDCSVPGNAPLIDFEVILLIRIQQDAVNVYFRGCTIESNLQMTLAKFNGGNHL